MAHPPLFPDASSIAHYRPRPTHATHRFDSRTDDRAAFGRFASHRRMPAVQLCRMIYDVVVHLCRRLPFGSAARANRSASVPTCCPSDAVSSMRGGETPTLHEARANALFGILCRFRRDALHTRRHPSSPVFTVAVAVRRHEISENCSRSAWYTRTPRARTLLLRAPASCNAPCAAAIQLYVGTNTHVRDARRPRASHRRHCSCRRLGHIVNPLARIPLVS